ncbi:hypothetical protein [Saccharothrix xinjiangensis]|uniref:Uncharacterized protein n=1 Tax=Saccharothrix xinjiangensis TaxID=204798 RepID=A0ABV9XQ74_9PSEU
MARDESPGFAGWLSAGGHTLPVAAGVALLVVVVVVATARANPATARRWASRLVDPSERL